MQQEVFEEQSEITPVQNVKDFVEHQKENYPLPLHQSGLQLMSSIANITACAMLVNEKHLNHNPSIFEEFSFERERENIQSLEEEKEKEKKDSALDQLSLRLTEGYRIELEKNLNDFFDNYVDHFNNQSNLERSTDFNTKKFKFSKEKGVKKTFYVYKRTAHELINYKREVEGNLLQEKAAELVKDEIEIKKVYEIYKSMARFLREQGVEPQALHKILTLAEINNRIKHTTH